VTKEKRCKKSADVLHRNKKVFIFALALKDKATKVDHNKKFSKKDLNFLVVRKKQLTLHSLQKRRVKNSDQ